MTLHIYDDLEQGTQEWLDARRGIVTASVVGQLLTPTGKVAANDYSRALTATLAAERITGWTEPVFVNRHMERGNISEPIARDVYAEHFGVTVREVGFMVEDKWGFPIGYSPDGLVDDDGLIEVKAPQPKTHLTTILADKVPAHYMAQVQCGLLISGRQWCDFLSFVGGMPLYPVRVYPDKKWHDAIITAATEFERAVAEITRTYRERTEGLPMTERLPDLEIVL